MDNTIIGAIIGASSAILINGLIFIISRSKELKREKIQVISELKSYLYSQLRYSRRYVGQQVWLNYYQISLRIIEPQFQTIVNNKIDRLIRSIEEIESKLIESDSKLNTLSAKYNSLFPRDKIFPRRIKEINDYVISEKIGIEDFRKWGVDRLKNLYETDQIREEELKTYKKLELSFYPIINSLIEDLERKI
jgi:hypothetical protein